MRTALLAALFSSAFVECQKPFPHQTAEAAAETARWIIANGRWGFLTTLSEGAPVCTVLSYSDGATTPTGRLFFYMMHHDAPNSQSESASLTISQAALNATTGCDATQTDPEDPRCAKLTLTGTLAEATGEAAVLGKAALFARHPAMAHWPSSHGFAVFELAVEEIWMIDFYGGGAAGLTAKLYYAAKPRHNVPHWPPTAAATSTSASTASVPPPWSEPAKRARWLAYHSLWASVGTVSVHLHGKPWGNVRSVADGVGANSTGLPFLYVPTPDPTSIDIKANPSVTLSLSEAALSERVAAGRICGGKDAEDPTCARLHISGTIKALTKASDIAKAEAAFSSRHPLAPWLGGGGAHTGGAYYTIAPTSLAFLDYYGGPAKLSVAEYLAASPPPPVAKQVASPVAATSDGPRIDDSCTMGPPHGSNQSANCPVTGEALNITSRTPSLAFKHGQRLYFISDAAAAAYRASPREYWLSPHDLPEPGMDGMRGLPDMRCQVLLCPRSAEPLNVSMKTPRVMQKHGQAVYFCCHGCVSAFWRDPTSLFA